MHINKPPDHSNQYVLPIIKDFLLFELTGGKIELLTDPKPFWGYNLEDLQDSEFLKKIIDPEDYQNFLNIGELSNSYNSFDFRIKHRSGYWVNYHALIYKENNHSSDSSRGVSWEVHKNIPVQKDVDFLVSTTAKVHEIHSREELFDLATEELSKYIQKNGLICISLYNKSLTEWRIIRLAGLIDPIVKVLEKYGIKNYNSLKGPVNKKIIEDLSTGKLTDQPLSLKYLMGEYYSKLLPDNFLKLLGIKSIKIINLIRGGKIFGSISIILTKEVHIYPKAIEVFAEQLSNALGNLDNEDKHSEAYRIAKIAPFEYNLKNQQILVSEEFRSEVLLNSSSKYNPLETIKYNINDCKKPLDLEVPIMKKNNKDLWVKIKAFPIVEGNQVIGSKGYIQDITDRIKTQIALEDSQKNYKALAESSSDFIIKLNVNAKIQYANTAFITLCNSSFEAIIEKDLEEVIGHDKKSRFFTSRIKETAKTKKPDRLIIDGSTRWGKSLFLDFRLFPVLEDSGEIEAVLCIARDISEEILHKNQLIEINEKLSNIIKNVPGAVYKCPVSTNTFEYISNQVIEITGYTPKEFLSKKISLEKLVYSKDKESFKSQYANISQNQSQFEFSYRIMTLDGKIKWICDKGGFIRYGKEWFREGILTDVTDRVKNEERIISATIRAEDIERKSISHQIHDGVQQRLVSSLMKLQSLEKKVSEIEDTSMSQTFKEGIKELQRGVNETIGIAYNIMPKSIQDFGLVSTIESYLSDQQRTTRLLIKFQQNIDNLRLSDEVETSLYKILVEATTNAIKYSEGTEMNIKLTKSKGTILLSIEDNGIGFNTTKENIWYSGYGISAMKSRAHAIGANFEISSEIDHGTKIVVVVPIT